MVNSFRQFTGDVRVSGHISQAGDRVNMYWLSELVGCAFFFFFRGRSLHVKLLLGCPTVSLKHYSLLAVSADKQMELGHGNDKKMDRVHWVGGKRDCFANKLGKCGCGLLGGKVSITMLCCTESSIRLLGPALKGRTDS